MYRDYLRAPTVIGQSQRAATNYSIGSRPSGYLYVPIAHTVQQLQQHSVEWASPQYYQYSQGDVPHRQLYLDQQDSLIYPSDLQRSLSPQLTMSSNSDVRRSRVSDVTFSPQLRNSRTEETHFLERTTVLEQRLPGQLSQLEQQEYREYIQQMEFRKRLESVDRKVECLNESSLALSHSPRRDFLQQFDRIIQRN